MIIMPPWLNRVTAASAQVQRNGLEAEQYSDLPFEQLVASLQPAQTRSYHPLFQVAFQWQQYAHDDLPKDLPKLFGGTEFTTRL